jgi:hypothetical protein
MENRKHFVLVGPKGQRAGLRNQHLLAIQLLGYAMTQNSNYGGLAVLALPQTQKEIAHLEKLIKKGYKAKLVTMRPGKAQRRTLREQAESADLLVSLAELFLADYPNSPRATASFCREFTQWICCKLRVPGTNKVKKLLETMHPELVNRTSQDWWQKRIAQRKK